MAVTLSNRVQETATAPSSASFALTGAVPGFQSFAVIGNGNFTYYAATDASGNWEVGRGEYVASGPSLLRTSQFQNSAGTIGTVVFSGTVTVFVTYPSQRSVNLDEFANVTPLGTVASGTWQGSTVGVAYGGTGVTASTGPNSVVLRDADGNVTGINNVEVGITFTTSAGTTTILTAAATQIQVLTGTANQTYKLPDATTLAAGTFYTFGNSSTGVLTVTDNANAVIETITQGGAAQVLCLSAATVAGTWGYRVFASSNTTWGNAILDYPGAITNAEWNGDTVSPAYGGTGLTTFAAANYALYSTSASTLTAGTLPVAAGGTGLTTYTLNGVVYASGTGTLATGSALTFDGTTLSAARYLSTSSSASLPAYAVEAGSGIFNAGASTIGFSAGSSELMRLTSTGLGIGTTSPTVKLDVVGTSATEQFRIGNTTGSTDFGITVTENASTIINSAEGATGRGIQFQSGGTNTVLIDSSGNLGIGTSSPGTKLTVAGTAELIRMANATPYLTFYNAAQSTRFGYIQHNGTNLALVNEQAGALEMYTSNTLRATLDASGNLGLGVTPSAWRTSEYKAIQVGIGASFYGRVTAGDEDKAGFSANAFFDQTDSRWEYIATDSASRYDQLGGGHYWFTAPSGTAGNAISFTQAMTLNASGNLSMAAAGAIVDSRINPRTVTTTSTATLTPDIQADDQFNITAQAQALSVAAPTGTPVDGNKLILRILDNGVARAITWNATYTAIGTTLPTTTTVNKTTYVECVYNANNTRWDVVDVNIQGYNAIGDIFFSTSPASENLLLCQGQRISKADYPALSGILPDFFNFAATTQTTRQFRGMAFNGSVFCSVVGGGSASNVAVTSPDGVTWTARTLPSTVTWQDIAWNGSVFFACAGGGSATSLAATSPDGITWTSRTLPSSSTWSRVIWNGTQFLAIATNSTAAATSTDGITWTARTLPSASAWNAIAWNGSEYLIVIQSSSSAITSPDGITWTTRTMPAASGWITLAANNSIFCAFRQNTTEAYTSSDNGVTWTRRFLPVSSNWTVLKWVNNAFFALGQGGTTLLRSTDGISWFAYTVNSQTWGGTNNIEFGNSTLVALTANGTGGFAGSFDSADYQAPFAGVSLGLYVVIRAR